MLDYGHDAIPAIEKKYDPIRLITEMWVDGKLGDAEYEHFMDFLEPEGTMEARVHRAVTWCFGAVQPILLYAEYAKANYELARAAAWRTFCGGLGLLRAIGSRGKG